MLGGSLREITKKLGVSKNAVINVKKKNGIKRKKKL